MDKKLFSDLVTSLKQAGQIAQGICARTKLSQSEFALLIGVSVKTLQNREQARRQPRGPIHGLQIKPRRL